MIPIRPDILCPRCRRINSRRATVCRFCTQALGFVDGNNCYFLVRVIKTGGQAVIFEAIDDNSHRTYAIKEIALPLDPDKALDAFQRCAVEARLLATLAHPGIPHFYSCIIENGRVYIIMDMVRGNDLEDVLRQRGQISEREVLSIASQVCDILYYLHHQTNAVVFRDVKPSNIMFDSDGFVTMIDFGVARFTNSQRGIVMGTPGYAPPEQYRGDISVVSDIYALGATMHHLLTGRDPRGQKPFSFPPVRDIAPHVSQLTADVVHRALQLNPNDRFLSALDMRAAIRAVIRSEDTDILPVIRDTSPIPTRAIINPTIGPNITNTLVEPQYTTRVITPSDAQQYITTNELSFIPQTPSNAPSITAPTDTPPPATPQVRHSPARRPALLTQRILIALLLLLCFVGGGIWVLQSTTLHWQLHTPQRISVTLTVDITPDTDIDTAFAQSYANYIRTTYGAEMKITSAPHFLGRPPTIISQNADGTTRYQGVVVADIAPSSP